MHDTDRRQLIFETDLEEFESDPYELTPYSLTSSTMQGARRESAVLSEADEMDLAAELLSTSDEQELDQFLGKLVGQAGQAAGQPVKGKVGSKLGNFLKGALKNVLPAVAGIAGTVVGGPAGGAIAGKLASAAGKAFGLELEGLSPEDQEFETARRFVRFAAEAARHAGRMNGAGDDPQRTAKKAVVAAAEKFAPGLLRPADEASDSEVARPRGGARGGQRPSERQSERPGEAQPADHVGQAGRWVRQGRQIVLLGL